MPEYEYYPIRVRGKFDHSREILIEPRTRLDDQSQDQRTGPRPGVGGGGQNFGAQVVTPFRVANRKYIFFLSNRLIFSCLNDILAKF